MGKTKRGLWIGIAFLMMGAGAVGVVLPILPTVPFLMAALYCFARGSQKLENWFRQTSLYQKHLEPFMDKKEMTRKAKLTVMLSMSFFMGIGFVMMEQVPVGRIILAAVWLFHILYFTLGIKTVKKTCVAGENFN